MMLENNKFGIGKMKKIERNVMYDDIFGIINYYLIVNGLSNNCLRANVISFDSFVLKLGGNNDK
jgi:hypothetical protein